MRLHICVQTHASRLDRAFSLVEALAAECDANGYDDVLQAIPDPEPDAALRSPWRTARLCWSAATGAGCTHKLVLQDDVILCDGFLGKVHAALLDKRESLVTFYVGRYPGGAARSIVAALLAGHPWADIGLDSWTPCLALAMPIEWGWDLAGVSDRISFPPAFVADDALVSHWRQERNHSSCWATVPSLVDHDNTVASLMGSPPDTMRMAVAIDETLPPRENVLAL